jgi:hypothetical protein
MDAVLDNTVMLETNHIQQVSATYGKDTEVPCSSHESTNLHGKACEDWLTLAEKLDKLQTLLQKSEKNSLELQTLIQKSEKNSLELQTRIQEAHKRRYARMKKEHETALQKVRAKYRAYGPTRNKVRRTGNTVTRHHKQSIVVISSDSEDSDDSEDSMDNENSEDIVVISSDSEDSDTDNDDSLDNENSEDTQNNNVTV